MTSPHQSDEKCTNSNKNGQSFRRVAERVQQWNRAIPEAGYITLGTIRYGVRLSSGQHPLATTHQGLPSILPPPVHSNENDHVTDPSQESTHSATPDTCCCVGQTSGIGLPWNSNFNSRTKLPVPTSVGAKNRTVSTTQSPSSFSLAVSSAPPPTHTTTSSRSQSFLSSVSLRDDRTTAAVTDRDAETLIQTDLSNKINAPVGTTSTQATIPKMIASCVATTPPTTTITPTTLYAGSDSNSRLVHRKRSCGCCQSSGGGSNNPISSNNTSTRSSTSNSIGCCCELNSGSVSVGQFRELSPPAISKSTLSTSPSSTSICCYTIANSSKSISKHANNHRTHHSHQKRIPRAILQQNLPDNKIVAGPPIPPPRPRPKNPSSSANNNNIHSNNRNSNDSQSIDPINFRRKLQHFESRKSDSHHENNAIGCGGGGDHAGGGGFELLNCFSSSSVNSDSSSRKNNCCSPNNSEISYSGSSSGKSDPQVITSKLQRTNNHDHLSYLNDSNQKRSPITRNNNSHPNLTSSKNSNNNCVVVRKLTPKLTKKTVPILQQYGVNNGHHNTGNDLHVLSQHVARSDSEDRLLRDSTVAPSSASSTCGGGGPINDNDRDRVTATLVEIVNDDDDDDDDGDDDDDYEYDDDQDDDDSEICFIDSSADGDHLSSQSDIDLIGSLNNHNINNYLTTTQNNTHQNRRAILSEPILTVAGARSLLPAATAKLPPSNNNLSYDHQVPNNSLINFNNSLRNNNRDTDTGKLISASSLSENFHLSNFLNNSKSNNNLRVVSVFNNNSKVNSNSSSGEYFDTSSGTTVLYRNDRIAPRIDRSRSFDFYKKSPAGGITVTGPALSTPSPPPLPPYPPPLIYTSQQLPLGGQNKGPYIIGRRVSSSDSFGNFTRNQLHASLSPETGLIMEKNRRNTLDRLQRLRFGRRSSPTPSQQDKSSSSSSRKANEKSEVLKELTERLKGNRSSPTPPPIPPPRKPRQCNSLEKPISDSSPLASSIFGSDDIIPMDEDVEHIPESVNLKSDDISHRLDEKRETYTKPPPPPPPLPAPSIALIPSTPLPQKTSLYQTLRPNTSVSNLESLILRRGYPDDAKSAPTDTVKEEDLFTKLPRAESRTIVGAYTQKSIPFRSASFSQIDYSSGKYIKSALSAIRDKLRRDKEPSVVDNANLTLPRKKDENRNHSPNRYLTHKDEENDRNSGKSDVTFSLSFEPETERMSLEEIVNPPDVILEEESSIAETEKTEISEDHKDQAEYPAEDQMDTTEIREEQLPETIAANYVDASETTLATLTEEEIPLESPPENLMQTATTCLIPVPVYECGAREWGIERAEEQWVNVEQNEIGMTPEGIDQLPDHLGPFRADGKVNMNSIPDVVSGEVSHINCDQVPTISVSPDMAHQSDSTSDKSSPDDKHVEFPEVRKRYSNDDLKVGDKTQISDAPIPRGNSIEEKRRIDKSRRRKGMYIQWPTINKHGVIENPEWEDEAQHDNNQNHQSTNAPTKGIHLDFSKIKVNIGRETENATFDIPTPASLYSSYDPSTPESECNRPVWPKGSADSRRTSLTCQSSEEKDDMPPQHSSGHKSHRSLMFLRSDSISDNECDQRSRDRTSPSPAPGDQDLKRYSKRPLRGPYGQMLEAEMKKPGKMHYDEILEDLKNSDSLNTLSPPIRNRAIVGNHSFDESAARQQKNSRSRKSSAHLPIPVHTRAASTPSQMENTSMTPSLDAIAPEHKRYQSNIDNTYLDASSAARLKDSAKKLSPDNRDRSPKRASSEALETKQQHAKRSASTASEKQQKRSLDEMRLSSRTPSERSMADSGKSSSNLLATPELLAELLKGSSERLVAEQRQQMFAISHKWFTLASPLYAKRRSKMSNVTTPPSPKSSSPSNNNNNNNNNNRQKLRLSLFDLHQSNLNSSCDNPSSQDEMPNNGSSSIDTVVTSRSDRFKKMPSSTCSDSEDDNDRKAQVDLNNKLNLQEEGDTRTHIVQEIFQNEQSYVEDLQTVIVKYLNVLKTPEYAGMIDSKTVDEVFFMVPEILNIHERFLNELRRRLDVWEPQQQVGDAFIEAFSRPEVLDTYTSFVNNCNRAKDTIRMTCQARPSFSRFLQATSREHKGKLTLDNLLIKPVQKFPNYELLFRRLIKHTDVDHLDQKPLQDALKLAHDILLHINCKKKEGLENGQREATLRELEGVIEGVSDLVATERQFLALDVVSMPNGQGARKERGFFLFSDLLVITSIKRRSGTIRKPNTTVCPGSVASTLDTNKYKFLMKIPLDNMEIVKSKDESLRKIMNEIDQLVDDYSKIQQITKIVSSLRCPHQHLEETIKDLHRDIDSQLKELKSQDNQLNMLELTVNLPNGIQNMSIAFSKPETRSQWEENFGEAKQKLAASLDRHPIPEFLTSIPIRKTRAGLQFTCASPTLSNQKDVWVCNSDGYVGQVCVLSLSPEPTVTSCNGVCNARILCVASVPACSDLTDQASVSSSNCDTPRSSRNSNSSTCHSLDKKLTKSIPETASSNIKLDSSSSSSDSEIEQVGNQERLPSPTPAVASHHQHQDSSDDGDGLQSTMWLGTEDGCIHVYNCTDNIRIKKNKIKIPHVSAVYSILYLDNRVFVSLANGDICVYLRDSAGWNTLSPHCIPIGTVTSPVNRLLNVHGKLWCSIQGIIKVLDTKTLQVENQIQISSDSKPITNMAVSNNYVWISIQNSAHIKCFHSNSYEQIFEVNLAPSVNKMLCNCDDIIRQHKAACLRVTSLLACKDMIWIGTSAGVLLTIPSLGHNKGSTSNTPVVTGIPHGHTGHVRFLTFVETEPGSNVSSDENGSIGYGVTEPKVNRLSLHTKSKSETGTVLIISGGDGYEDFRSSGANTMSEVAGREDSTNHLLLWQM